MKIDTPLTLPTNPQAGPSRTAAPPRSVVDAASLDDFQLPPKTVFDRAMPRYPNVWFYVDASLADSQASTPASPGNLVERVHDPLGVELLLNGTIRNAVVRYHHEGQREVGGILRPLGDRFAVQHQVFPAQSGDRNTLRIGVVVIGSRR